MSKKAIFRLVHDRAREGAVAAVQRAEHGVVVTLAPPTRNLDQNALCHKRLSDIAGQMTWHGKKLNLDVWKRLATAAWLREQNEQPMLVPALDGQGFDVIFERTSRMTVAQMSSLIDWITAWGANNGVKFTD